MIHVRVQADRKLQTARVCTYNKNKKINLKKTKNKRISARVHVCTCVCVRNRSGSLPAAYKKHEDIKKRAYGQRVRDVECGVFTPLVFSTTGGMGREATTFYKRLADMLARKQQMPYPVVISWLRCKLSFAAVRSSIMCIRGTRSSINRPLRDADITLATSEGGIPQDE